MLNAVSESMALRDLARLGADFRADAVGEFGGILRLDRVVGDETVPAGARSVLSGDLEIRPVDMGGIGAVAGRDGGHAAAAADAQDRAGAGS